VSAHHRPPGVFSVPSPYGLRGDASPLTTPRGELVGAVVLLSDPSGFDDDLMDHLCQAVAVAFENQRLYAVEHQIALTLQQAMLPQSLPQPSYLDMAVRYQAASDTVEIGGDFYEAIELDDRVLLAIGDVAGHSLRAATVMAELRHSLRAFTTLGLRPAEIIDPSRHNPLRLPRRSHRDHVLRRDRALRP
jgi:Stage II sporulation protein E (SpoIIE)